MERTKKRQTTDVAETDERKRPRCDFWRLLISFAISFDPDQD